MLKVKVYKNNTNKVNIIVCGKSIYEKFANADLAKCGIGYEAITEETKIIKDQFMKPNQFIGLDSNNDWVFSCL